MSDRGSEKFQGMVMELVLVCCYLVYNCLTYVVNTESIKVFLQAGRTALSPSVPLAALLLTFNPTPTKSGVAFGVLSSVILRIAAVNPALFVSTTDLDINRPPY